MKRRGQTPAFQVAPIDSLRALHEGLWDGERSMVRLAPGVVPGVDISSLNLHAVRETALGAFLDLRDGNVDRAVVALRSVLALQYPLSDWPWSGTFRVTAEQHDPPGADAVEWVHYDPNWRQFVGCILLLCALEYSNVLPVDLRAGISEAAERCVVGEPVDRIAHWYTNPNLMHAWLQGHVAAATGDGDLLQTAHARVDMIVGRFAKYGDVDEYNSPTYDGIDMMALGLWAVHPPTDAFARAAATMLRQIGARISALYHPRFGTSCGPYIRSYGFDPTRYVSLSGLLYSVAGEPPERVLPSPIDADTVHVHDLYFLPLLEHVAPALRPHLRFDPVTDGRHHVQRFGTSVAQSLLRPDLAIGWDRGRRHDASLDQYAPLTVHGVDSAARLLAFAVMVPDETAWVDCDRTAEDVFEITAVARAGRVGLRIVTDGAVDAHGARIGPCELRFGAPADLIEESTTPRGREFHVSWPTDRVGARLSILPD